VGGAFPADLSTSGYSIIGSAAGLGPASSSSSLDTRTMKQFYSSRFYSWATRDAYGINYNAEYALVHDEISGLTYISVHSIPASLLPRNWGG